MLQAHTEGTNTNRIVATIAAKKEQFLHKISFKYFKELIKTLCDSQIDRNI
jgi:hypothetical protein